jgi:hypothetical protein
MHASLEVSENEKGQTPLISRREIIGADPFDFVAFMARKV